MPNSIGRVLEELKSGIDKTHAATRERWIKGKKVILHPPASDKTRTVRPVATHLLTLLDERRFDSFCAGRDAPMRRN